MNRKDQIKTQVREAIELLPDMATAIKGFDPASAVAHFPTAATLGVAGVVGYLSKKFGKRKDNTPASPLGTAKVKPRGIPGIFSIGDPRQRS